MDHPLNDPVECHSGFEYADRPVALHYQGERFEITEIIARWRIPGGRCFRVMTVVGRTFELFYGELYDEWRVNPA